LAADELVRNGPDPLEVVERGAADLVILKVQPMGGVAVVLEITARCGVPVVISSALETSIGMFGGVLAAAALPELPFACGLGTVGLMGGDPTSDPLIPHNGYLEVRRPEPDPELLETWKPGPSVVAAMMERVRSAADVMP
jgi:O-succinylbenzoate synthase